jgi:dienelactone hydrolase
MRRILVCTLFALALAGCGAADGPGASVSGTGSASGSGSVPGTSAAPAEGTTSTVAPGPPFAVTTMAETLVDTSRVTPATDAAPERVGRTLETTIIAPTADGPFPLIVFSHGLTGDPARHTELSSAWAEAGYVVAMPAFPLTNASVANANGNVADVANQPGDVSFVIDQVLAASADPASPLHGKVLADRIGVAGHSLGGATTYGVAQNDCCRDDRIDAVIVMSGLRLVNPSGDHLGSMPPTMLLHGVADPVLKVAMADDIYPQLSAPKWYVRLLVAGHSEAYENTPSPSDGVVTAATTDFWQAYLAPQAGAPDPAILDRLRQDAEVDQISTLQSDLG